MIHFCVPDSSQVTPDVIVIKNMKLSKAQKIFATPYCFEAISLGIIIAGMLLPSIFYSEEKEAFLPLFLIELMFITYIIFSYKKTTEILTSGISVLGKVTIIRNTYISRRWIKLDYEVKNQSFSKKMEMSTGEMNKDKTVHLQIDQDNYKKFRVLPPTVNHPSVAEEMQKENKESYTVFIIAMILFFGYVIYEMFKFL